MKADKLRAALAAIRKAEELMGEAYAVVRAAMQDAATDTPKSTRKVEAPAEAPAAVQDDD